jgi:hypothetical protein
MVSSSRTVPILLVNRTLQWSSAIIVMGLTSYFISKGPRGEHITYVEVIVRTGEQSDIGEIVLIMANI